MNSRALLVAAGMLWTVALCATPIRFGTWNIRLATMDNWEKDPRFQKWEARMTDRVDGRKFLFFNTHFDHRSQLAREKEDAKAGNRIDHIFLTPGTKVSSYETFGDLYGDNFYPSDHFPIRVLMEWPSIRGRLSNRCLTELRMENGRCQPL